MLVGVLVFLLSPYLGGYHYCSTPSYLKSSCPNPVSFLAFYFGGLATVVLSFSALVFSLVREAFSRVNRKTNQPSTYQHLTSQRLITQPSPR